MTGLGIALLVWLPWRYVYWRPKSLPASTGEIVFAGVKLVFIYGLSQLAWALSLWTAARTGTRACGVRRRPAGRRARSGTALPRDHALL